MTGVSLHPRPAGAFEPLALLQAVRQVAEAADPDRPQDVSTRTWDSARVVSEHFADAPAARRICEHLRLPWAKVRDLAFIEGTGQLIALGRALNEAQGEWLTAEYCDYILKLVARKLGVTSLTPGQYRSAMRDTQTQNRSALRVPTEHQIAALAGSWDRAFAHAGLSARTGRGGQRARSGPPTIIDLLDRCYEHHAAEPTGKELELFARANGIPMPRRGRGIPWRAYVAEWKERRRAEGLGVPDGPPPKRQRPDYTIDVGAALPGERRKTDWRNLDDVASWVADYLAGLPRGARSSQRAYADWAREHVGAPWPQAFEQHGGWKVVRAAAQQRVRAGRSSQRRDRLSPHQEHSASD